MAITVGELVARFTADTKGLDAGLKAAETGLKKAERAASHAEAKFDAVTTGMGRLGDAAGAALIGFGGFATAAGGAALAAVQLAASADAAANKFGIVFGDEAGRVTDELQRFSEVTNIGEMTLSRFASGLQDTFVPLGFARDAAADLSVTTTQLIADLSAFNDIPLEETAAAVQSALVGNHETMRAYGVIITEATIQQELLRMGIDLTTREATEQEKVMARLNLMMAGSADAMGAAESEADNFTQSAAALMDNLKEIGVLVGDELMPAFQEATIGLREFTSEFVITPGMQGFGNYLLSSVQAIRQYGFLGATGARVSQIMANNFGDAARETVSAYTSAEEYNRTLIDQALAQGIITQQGAKQIDQLLRYGHAYNQLGFNATQQTQQWANSIGIMTETQFEAAQSSDALAAAVAASVDPLDQFLDTAEETATAVEQLASAEDIAAARAGLLNSRLENMTRFGDELFGPLNELESLTQRAADGFYVSADAVNDLQSEIGEFVEGAFVSTLLGQLQQMADLGNTGAFDALIEGLRAINPEMAEQMENSQALSETTSIFGEALANGSISAEQYALMVADYTAAIQSGITPLEASEQAVKDLQAAQELHAHGGLTLLGPIEQYSGAVGGIEYAASRAAQQVERLADAIRNMPLDPSAGGIDIGDVGSGGFGGLRADGGPVVGGKSYLVGERGPEIVTMPASGYVTPNEAIGGQTVNVYFTNTTVMDNRMVDYITQQVARAIRN